MKRGPGTLVSKAEIEFLIKRATQILEKELKKKFDITKTSPSQFENLAETLRKIVKESEYFKTNYNEADVSEPPITNVQLRDASHVIKEVKRVQDITLDALYFYNYEMPRKNFVKGPTDEKLIRLITEAKEQEASTLDAIELENESLRLNISTFEQEKEDLKQNISSLEQEKEAGKQNLSILENANEGLTVQIAEIIREKDVSQKTLKTKRKLVLAMGSLLAALVIAFTFWFLRWDTIKKDYNILPYKPSQAQIESLVGVWKVYAPSPQARVLDSNRYHMVAPNLMSITYKANLGYFVFERYGPGFSQRGVMEFKSSAVVYVYAQTITKADTVESPKYSSLILEKDKPYQLAISASWNFDAGSKNIPLGLREVYIKLGHDGLLTVERESKETASCHCAIVYWKLDNKRVDTFKLRNEFLDTLAQPLRNLLDENSMLERIPNEGHILRTNKQPPTGS